MNGQWQEKKSNGRGIEWADFTWNPVGGCFHGCRWTMPDGTTAICYAENTAENTRIKSAYPNGFEHHYWRPHLLKEPGKVALPSLVFCDSMSDLMGHWVPSEQRGEVFKVMENNPHHTFQMLTKAAPQLLKVEKLPRNLWAGVSSPPDVMFGKPVSRSAQVKMLSKTLDILAEVKKRHGVITFMSIEPLSWDVAPLLAEHTHALDWAIIGAATNGPKKFQPEPAHVQGLLDVFDGRGTPVFFKGNLAWNHRREDFPVDKYPYNKAVMQRHSHSVAYGWPQNQQVFRLLDPNSEPAGGM